MFEYFRDLMLYGGLSKADFNEVREQANKENLRNFCIIDLAIFGFVLVLLLLSWALSPLVKYRTAYIVLVAILLALYFPAKIVGRRHPNVTPLFWYFLGIGVFVYGTLDGAVADNLTLNPIFCAFLIAFPLIFLDRPITTFFFEVIMLAVNAVITYNVKPLYYFRTDLINTVCFLILSAGINAVVTKNQLNALVLRKTLRIQRDTDPMTGLMTKAAFTSAVREYISTGMEDAYLFMLDLDYFKRVNDTYGHDKGDEVIKSAAKAVESVFRNIDSKARFGGDEFQILLMTRDIDDARYYAGLLNEEMARQVILPNGEAVTCSIGIAPVSSCNGNYETLFDYADFALYNAKANGRNQYNFYYKGMTMPENR